MAYASHRRPRSALLAVVLLVACSSGEGNDEGGPATTTGISSATDPSSSGGSSGSSGEPTTTAGPGTTDDATTQTPTTSEGDGTTSTTAATLTTGDDTGSTGPICDPGGPNCVCDGDTCVDGYVCTAGVCVEQTLCPGEDESPGDSETTPKDLGDITDNDDDFFAVTNVLNGASDADWYYYDAADKFGYIAEPTLELVSGSQRMCLFMLCANGNAAMTSVECPEGSEFAISPMLRPGCCSEATMVIKELNCDGQDESAHIWARIDKPAADACSDYEVKLHF